MELSEDLISHLLELEKVRADQDQIALQINKYHSKLLETEIEKAEKLKDRLWTKLRGFYTEARKLAEREERLYHLCAQELDPSIPSPPTPSGIKRKTSQAFRGRVPHPHVNLVTVNEQVAARVSPADSAKDDWILVKVVSIDKAADCFNVVDDEPGDDEEGIPTQRKYSLPGECIIPLPKPSERFLAPDYPVGSRVLAVYPGTTALYRATVAVQPQKKNEEYNLEFDDDEQEGVNGLPQRFVPFYHIVDLPEGHRQ